MFSFAFYGLLIYVTWTFVKNRWLRYIISLILVVIILSVGASRVYLGVHFATDVLAGFLAGFIWLVTSILVIRYIESLIRRRIRKQADLPPKPEDQEEESTVDGR